MTRYMYALKNGGAQFLVSIFIFKPLDSEDKLTSLNLMGLDDNVIATQRKGEGSAAWYLYNKDVRESTSSVINSAGELAKAYEYDEFGETTARAGESDWLYWAGL